jgi:hypothetical protein
MVGGMILWVSIIPMIRARNKPPFLTSVPTSVILSVFVVCLATLKLYLAAFSTTFTAALWWILVFQHIYQQKRRSKAKI